MTPIAISNTAGPRGGFLTELSAGQGPKHRREPRSAQPSVSCQHLTWLPGTDGCRGGSPTENGPVVLGSITVWKRGLAARVAEAKPPALGATGFIQHFRCEMPALPKSG